MSVVSEDTRPLNSQPTTANRQPPTDNRQPTTDSDGQVNMTILAPTGAPPKRHLDAASDVAGDFRPRESTPEPSAPSLRIVHLGKYFHPAHGGIERTVRSLATRRPGSAARCE